MGRASFFHHLLGCSLTRFRLFGSIAATLAAVPAAADVSARTAFDGREYGAVVRLVTSFDRAPAGESLRVGFEIVPAAGWHFYWTNPGDSALPTRLHLDAGGVEVTAFEWPTPEVFIEEATGIRTFGYRTATVLSAPFQIAATQPAGPLVLRGEASFLACKTQCVPAVAHLDREIVVGVGPPRMTSDFAALARATAATPKSAESLGVTVSVATAGELAAGSGVPFFVEFDPCPGDGPCTRRPAGPPPFEALAYEALDGVTLYVTAVDPHPAGDGRWLIEATAFADREAPPGPRIFSGILRLRDGAALIGARFEAPVFTVTEPVGAPPPPELGSVAAHTPVVPPPAAMSIWLAFLGGLILNLMPCVFPVLAIKVTSFVELSRDTRRGNGAHAAAYTAGTVGSFVALALLVMALRSGGARVGWGFQFQEPMFLAALASLMVLFSLNLFGVYEIRIHGSAIADRTKRAHGLERSFLEGVLAVVLATPCSAPLVGTTVGFALAAPLPLALAVFAAMGLGLATPFAVMVLIPGAANWLPRPGRWMNGLKIVLGCSLLVTAAWLVWLTERVGGATTAGRVVLIECAVVAAAWGYGRLQRAERGHPAVALALAAVVTSLGALALSSVTKPPPDIQGRGAWQVFSRQRLDLELAAGRPVFVDFTADWCITCKVNERTVLYREETDRLFAAHGVVPLVADWTHRDDAIGAELAAIGRAAVPTYVLYDPADRRHPIVLPEVLTPGSISAALQRLRTASR